MAGASGRKAALVVLGAVLLLSAPFSVVALTDEEICGRAVNWFDYDGMHYWKSDRNERFVRIVRELGVKELPADGIVICSGEGWLGRTLHLLTYFNEDTFLEERRGLAVHLEFLREAPDDIVGLAVRHEVGHLAGGHLKRVCYDPYDDEVSMRCEQEADDAAAAIVGPCPIARLLSWLVHYYERHNVSIYKRVLTLRMERQMRAGNCPESNASNPFGQSQGSRRLAASGWPLFINRDPEVRVLLLIPVMSWTRQPALRSAVPSR